MTPPIGTKCREISISDCRSFAAAGERHHRV